MIRVSGVGGVCSGAGAMAERGTVEPQLDGDLRRRGFGIFVPVAMI